MRISQYYFEKNLKKNYLFEKLPKIAVAVSGGPDSMCLTFLLNNWLKSNKGSIIALIIDHHLRIDSKKEANKIKTYLSKNKINSKIIKVSKTKIIKKNMNEARNNRFEKLIHYCKKNNILHLFVGHHYDDNIETFLLRKIAGSNFEGLRGIKKKITNNSLQIIRPLLNFKKRDIMNYNKLNEIFYVLDPSNDNKKYSRVAIRDFLIKKDKFYKEIESDFREIKKYYPFYKQMIFQIFNKIAINIQKNYIKVDLNNFLKQDKEVQKKIFEIIYKYLMSNRQPLRYKKIQYSLSLVLSNTNIKTNLAGMNVERGDFLINFSNKL